MIWSFPNVRFISRIKVKKVQMRKFNDYLNEKLKDAEFAETYSEVSKEVEGDLLKTIWHEGYKSNAKSVLENPYSLQTNADFHYEWRNGLESKGKAIKFLRDK